MGKFLTPSLLLLILFLFLGMLGLDKNVAAPLDAYKESAFAKGFIEGYNTMDAVAALNFGLVISLAIKRFGVENDKEVVNYSLKSGFLAGGLLFVVYAMLSYIGKITSNVFVGAENGAEILSQSSQLVFGSFGSLLMVAIFTLACLTTCVGLITSGSEYFTGLFKEKLSYKAWVRIWTSLSFVVANFGLNKILSVSVPILQIIYPVALVLIIMGISHDFMKYTRLSYLLTAAIALVIPMVEVAYNYLPQLKNLFLLFGKLPLAQHGLARTLPSLIALLVTVLYSKVEQAVKSNTINSQEASYSK
jgi:LIVCS family branched-chain amino acid:cation transporter